ncbi:MAG TPA: hypothetical protein VII33_01035, partial [Nakamurella sp.]
STVIGDLHAATADDDEHEISTRRSMNSDQPVVSGQCYTVTVVNGHHPVGLADFAGRTSLTVMKDGQVHSLVGEGAQTSGMVRFHQKDPGPDDKDVRVWAVTEQAGGTFLAEPVARF